MTEHQRELDIAIDIARKAGGVMRQYFDGDQQKVYKADNTPLTIADTMVNRMVIEQLAQHFPDDIVIGEEESTGGYGAGRRWFCDPIDGTKAFTWGVPTAMFSLGLVIDGVPTVGVAYDPFLDRMYTAVRGYGAYCNGQLLHVSDETLDTGIVAIGSGMRDTRRGLPYLDEFIAQNIRTASFSGAVYKSMLVARGKFVGYVLDKVNAYDMAAAHVIITEAGGVISGYDGQSYDYTQPFRGTIIGNSPDTHTRLAEIVTKHT